MATFNRFNFRNMKISVLFILTLFAFSCYGQEADTFMLHYALRETTLNKTNRAVLNKLIYGKKITPGMKFTILGFADYRGTGPHNDTVSSERAMNVLAYLVSKGFDKKDITDCVGKGKIERPGMTGINGNAPDRKVLIITPHATHIDINTLEVNETVTLKNIQFEGGLPDIEQSSMPELENLLNFMTRNKKVNIQIEGHVCCKGIKTVSEGPYSDDMQLSALRAKAIFDYLAAKGISKTRMKYVGYGTSRPLVYPAVTEDDQTKNRRVEIRILSK